MHHSHTHPYPCGCHPCHQHHPHGPCACSQPAYSAVLVPWYPAPWYWDSGHHPMTVPEEVTADSAGTTAEGMIGGNCDVHLSLEYATDAGATSPSVKVTITDGGATSTWEESSIPEGYHVKTDFASLSPGSKVTLEVNEATARLRWCETVCC